MVDSKYCQIAKLRALIGLILVIKIFTPSKPSICVWNLICVVNPQVCVGSDLAGHSHYPTV